MKEPITKFDLEAAFKALDEIDIPVAEKGIHANKPALTEIFSRKTKFDALLEEYYDIGNPAELDDAKLAREAEVAQAKLARIEKIVDLDAESPEDLLPSYVGKFIIQCPQCMTLFYKNPEDVEKSEEDPAIVNINEVCQHCGNESGYTLIGKVDEATQEEQAEVNDTQEIDVDSTEDGEDNQEELLNVEDTLDDIDLDAEGDLEALDLDLDLEEEEEEESDTQEESFQLPKDNTLLTEQFDDKALTESAGGDAKQVASEILTVVAKENEQEWANTVKEIVAVIPDNLIDDLFNKIGEILGDIKLSNHDKEQIANAAGANLENTEEADTLGKILSLLDIVELAETSPELLKAIAVTILTIVGIIEPTPVVECIVGVILLLPADIVAKVFAAIQLLPISPAAPLNLMSIVGHVANQGHKRNKQFASGAGSVSEDEAITEEVDLEVSSDEFEELISSPEFKKPITDTEARSMLNTEADDTKENKELKEVVDYSIDSDILADHIDDVMYTGKFLNAKWTKAAASVKRLDQATYRVIHNSGGTSVLVKFDMTNPEDSTLKFAVDKNRFVAKTVKEAQEYILRELDAKHRRQFDIDLGESINVETEPLEEGGLKDLGKAIGKKIGQAGKNVKNKISNAIDRLADSAKTREEKANWILANALEDYSKAKADTKGQLAPDVNNQKFKSFVVIGYSDKYSNGKTITAAPSYNNKELVVGKNGIQEKTAYEDADKIAKGWSMTQGNGPAFIYLAKNKEDKEAVFMCEYFRGDLVNDQLEKYFKVVKDHLAGALLMADGGMAEEHAAEAGESESKVASDFEKNKAVAKERIEQLSDSPEGIATLATIMSNLADLQESTMESMISNSLVEAYGNVAGFRLKECSYCDEKFAIEGTIHFTSGNTRKTTYVFTEAFTTEDGKIKLAGFNEKLGLDKQFTITGHNTDRMFIAESFKYNKK